MPSCRASTRTDAPRGAKLFRSGRSQALQTPRELELPGDEVILHGEDDHLIVERAARRHSLAEILPGLHLLTEDFPETSDPPVRPEDVL